MKKIYLCFVQNEMPAGSFFMQLKELWQFRFEEVSIKIFEDTCIFINDYPRYAKMKPIQRFFYERKRRRFAKSYKEKCGDLEVMTRCVKTTYDYPPEIATACMTSFLKAALTETGVAPGIIDGEEAECRMWIRLLRSYMERLNFLVIVTKRPERFGEFCEDAWEEFGLAVVVSEHESELAYCNRILDCTRDELVPRVGLRDDCQYMLLHAHKRKVKRLMMKNDKIKVISCADFAQKV